ncbi:hypothetical protein RB599_010264 [Gaeumannomyces hyphopodioides]
MTVFAMFFVELLVTRYAILGKAPRVSLHGVGGYDPSLDFIKASGQTPDQEKGPAGPETAGHVSCPPNQQVQQAEGGNDQASPLTTLLILEFGVVFHSILIGLTLAVSGEEFVILYVVLVFHQTFEGLGLGSRFAIAIWPSGGEWLPYVLSLAYSLSTPIAIAAGLGLRGTLEPKTHTALVVMGVLDAISAGILLYTGLVGLMAHEFLLNDRVKHGRSVPNFAAFGCMCLGAALMALLGKWA